MKTKSFIPGRSFIFLIMLAFISLPILSQVEKCVSDKIHQRQLLNDPSYVLKMQQYESYVQTFQNSTNKVQSVVYKIPVVVNIMHKGEAVGVGTNVSDAAVQNAIKVMNEMYRKVAGTQGDGNGVDVEIEYVLAVRDPNGNCTNGINRFSMAGNSAYMNNGVDYDLTGGISDLALKGTLVWNQSLYYNIWLVSEIDNNEGGSGTQGYAYFASSHGQSVDGALILSSNFTSGTSTTAAHEIGHSLNLYHTFQGDGSGSTCPTDAVCGTSGDCCADTPPHKRSTSNCASGTNTCTGTSTDLYIHNYMDYSSDLCQNMLTANQKTRMIAALTGQRASFLGPDNGGSNMGLVPVNVASVDFESSGSILCGTGQSISFIDKSTCVPNSYVPTSSFAGITYSWTVTNGTNTYTSTIQNPIITFNNAGTFNVTLVVTNAHGAASATKTGMIVVSSAPSLPCTPTSQNASNYGQTISNVAFNTINSTTSANTNVAYTNLTCSYNTIVTAGNVYNLAISANAGTSGVEVFEVYINYNNDNDFADAGELVFSGSAPLSTSGTYTSNITIPLSAATNSLVRMRVIGETTNISASERTCGAALFVGDVEDYGVYILPAGCAAPSITGTTPASRCSTGTITIGATASAGIVNWYSAATGGTAITTGNSFTTPSLSTTTTYYVDATNAGCTTSSRTAVTASVNAIPTVNLSPSTSTVCSGQSTVLNASGATTYSWLPSGSGTTSTVSPVSTTIYTVTGYNGSCTNSITATVTAITCSTVPLTQLNSTWCNATLTTLDANTRPSCNPVTNATDYEWEFTDQSTSTTVLTKRRGAQWTDFYLTGYFPNIQYNKTYSIKVRAKVGGIWGTYGSACTITTPGTLLAPTKVRNDFCGVTLPSLNSTTKIYCDIVTGATNYEWQLTEVLTGNIVLTKQRSAQWSDFYLKGYFPTIKYNYTYSIIVRAYVNGVWGTFGTACLITTSSPGARFANQLSMGDELENGVIITMYPNPTSETMNIDFDLVPENASIQVYNTIGELVLKQSLSDMSNSINTSTLSNGLYHVKIIGNNQLLSTRKIVKQ